MCIGGAAGHFATVGGGGAGGRALHGGSAPPNSRLHRQRGASRAGRAQSDSGLLEAKFECRLKRAKYEYTKIRVYKNTSI